LCHVQQQVQQRKARHHELHAHGTSVAAHHGCGDLGNLGMAMLGGSSQ
jgi:hypothetical protein